MAEFVVCDDIFDSGRSWQWRILRASFATTTGCIVRAILGKEPKSGIAFGATCDITVDGYVESQIRMDGFWRAPVRIGTVEDVRDNLRRLSDHCKLSDAERENLFSELRKWIRKDGRARSEI